MTDEIMTPEQTEGASWRNALKAACKDLARLRVACVTWRGHARRLECEAINLRVELNALSLASAERVRGLEAQLHSAESELESKLRSRDAAAELDSKLCDMLEAKLNESKARVLELEDKLKADLRSMEASEATAVHDADLTGTSRIAELEAMVSTRNNTIANWAKEFAKTKLTLEELATNNTEARSCHLEVMVSTRDKVIDQMTKDFEKAMALQGAENERLKSELSVVTEVIAKIRRREGP